MSMAATDRALMLAVPGLAVLAAFALPTLKRSAAAAIDWFSVFFFTRSPLSGSSTPPPDRHAGQAGGPRGPAPPGFAQLLAARPLSALAGTAPGWGWCAGARAAAHAVWKSLVLPAGGWRSAGCSCSPWGCRCSTTRAAIARWCSASRSRGAGQRLHRRARHGARPGRGPRILRPLSRRRRHERDRSRRFASS